MSYPAILYDNILASGVTATDTDATGDYSVDYLYDLRPYTYWKAASSGTKYITMDAGAAVTVDALGIFSHNLGTASATVSLESSTTGAWAGEEVEQIAGFDPSNDKAIYKSFTPATVRYWRIKIVTASVAAEVAVAILGEALDFPVYPDVPFTSRTEQVNATAALSKGGHLLGVTSRYTPLTIRAKFSWPPMSFIDGDFQTFWEDHGKQLKPFFWVPNLSQWAAKIYFVRLSTRYSFSVAQQDITNADRLDLRMEGIAE